MRLYANVALLWLVGIGLRITILAVPPVVPIIATDLQLPATGVGLLVSSPVFLFALAALPGSLLIARLGPFPTIVGGLLLVAVGAALRGVSPNALVLYATTMVMGSGVAIMQPAMPAAVRQWVPAHIGFGTAVYTNGLLLGEVIPVIFTLPAVMPLVGNQWRLELAFWSIPVFLTAILVAVFGQRSTTHASGVAASRRWLPDWRSGLVWRLGLLFACINSMYFGANAFLPGFLNSVGRGDLTSASLTALNFGQIPASLVLLAVAGRLVRRVWPFVVAGGVSLVCLIGLVTMPGAWPVVWCAIYGFVGAAALTLGLALPPLLCEPEDVARTAASMFTISYTSAVAMSTLSGAAWDLSGVSGLAFGPAAVCAVGLGVAALLLKADRRLV